MASPEGRKLVRWVQTVQPPSDPDEFAFIAIQAIIAASFNAHTAARIFDDTVKPALLEDRPIFPLFSHPGKAEAIEQW